ncbi:MAG: NAD(P)H-hydrate epimerase [Candidatus Omnitrophota bacterium]
MKSNGVTAEKMAEIDRRAQDDFGIAQIVLMENAGRAVAEIILAENSPAKTSRIALFCGKGNNGGDGFVAARHLFNEHPGCLVVYAPDASDIKPGAASDNFRVVRKMGIDIRPMRSFLRQREKEKDYTVAVDAVFGTGFRGALPEEYAEAWRYVNASDMKVYAVDIPSGLDATTGAAAESCIKAHKTITFGLPKKGFFVADGPHVCGEIVTRNVGFPSVLLEEAING